MPRASSLEAEIKEKYADAEVELIPGSKGAYEVIVDGKHIFSKIELMRFPKDGEILGLM